MGNRKLMWTAEEEKALIAGVAKHGTGKWKNIERDPEFNPYLSSRSNIDLKDKWRNMSVSNGPQGTREKSRTPKRKGNLVNSDAPPTTTVATPAVVDLVDAAYSSKSVADTKAAPKYNMMIFEAISTSNDPNGADTSAILSYIEQREEVPQNFRRQLNARLRRLISQQKLEKVNNSYRIADGSVLGIKTPSPKQKEVQPRPLQSSGFVNSRDPIDEAAVAAAYRVAEAENKSFVAAEAVREAERVSKMAEEADLMLQSAKEIFEKCFRGEVVLMAESIGFMR